MRSRPESYTPILKAEKGGCECGAKTIPRSSCVREDRTRSVVKPQKMEATDREGQDSASRTRMMAK